MKGSPQKKDQCEKLALFQLDSHFTPFLQVPAQVQTTANVFLVLYSTVILFSTQVNANTKQWEAIKIKTSC